jgi:deoxyribodipyrimidine photolyase-related protein
MAFLLFPHQLYSELSHLKDDSIKQIYIIEEPRYFTDFRFHKLKLAYHRASMKKYYDMLIKKKFKVKYIDFSNVSNLFYQSIKTDFDQVSVVYPGDLNLEKKLEKIFGKKLVI